VGPVTLGIYTTTGGEVSTLVSKTAVGTSSGVVTTTAGTKQYLK
jgi:formiminotetrahydrofolate cyclodeaminase